jgi:hypothetical protein
MPAGRINHRRVVHKSTAGILNPIPEAVDLVGNSPPRLTNNTVAHPARKNAPASPVRARPQKEKIDSLFQGEKINENHVKNIGTLLLQP